MANEVQEVEAGARINHPVFQDVYNTTFAKATITDFEMIDVGEFTGMCKTSEYDWLPVFYHCKKGCYSEDVASLQDNDSLKNGVLAFSIGDEVKVLLEEGKPKYIVGHIEQYNPPRMCEDVFRADCTWMSGEYRNKFYVGSAEEELVDGRDVHGDAVICERENIILCEGNYNWPSSSFWYESDRLIRVGSLMYIFWVRGRYSWLHYSDNCWVYQMWKGLWSQAKEDSCLARWEGEDLDDHHSYERTVYYDDLDLVILSATFSDLITHDLTDCNQWPNCYVPEGVDLRTIKFYGQGD